MATLPHQKCSLRSLEYVPTSHRPCHSTGVTCSATTSTKHKLRSSSPNQLITEPRLVTSPPLFINDPTLQSTWAHRAWVATGCTTVLVCLAKSMVAAASSHVWLEPLLAGYVAYILADLVSGVYHWAIDNYGDASTPIFGAQIDAFQGHHKWPWPITKRQFANNLHVLARAITFTVLPFVIMCNDATINGFVSVFAGCTLFSQQFHAWAHGTKSKLPQLVVALQDAGVLLSRSQHAGHHRPPYNDNYCIVSGIWNEFLDKNKVFEILEVVLFFTLGVRPRSWSEPSSEWTEDAETTSQVAAP